jgi:hypothetical protein
MPNAVSELLSLAKSPDIELLAAVQRIGSRRAINELFDHAVDVQHHDPEAAMRCARLITLADGRRMPIRDDAVAILRLLETPRIDAQEVFGIGRRLFEVGGIEPLEAIIDAVVRRLGRETAAELVMIWTAVIEGEDVAT